MYKVYFCGAKRCFTITSNFINDSQEFDGNVSIQWWVSYVVHGFIAVRNVIVQKYIEKKFFRTTTFSANRSLNFSTYNSIKLCYLLNWNKKSSSQSSWLDGLNNSPSRGIVRAYSFNLITLSIKPAQRDTFSHFSTFSLLEIEENTVAGFL